MNFSLQVRMAAILLGGCSLHGVAFAAEAAQDSRPGNAAQATAEDTGDIVVTATRREQNLREVPAAVSVLSGNAIADAHVGNANDLNAIVPSLQVNRNNSNVGFTIRGIGSQFRSEGTDNSIAFHRDGFYVARPAAAAGAFFDVDRIEVLRGPQGTLYGRNATAGAINVISRLPTADTRGYAAFTAGNYGALEAEGAIGGALIGDTLLARVGAYSRNRLKGFGKNLTTGDEIDNLKEWGAKATLLWRPSSAFTAILRGDYYGAHDNAYGVLLRRAAPNRPPVAFDAAGRPITLAEARGGFRPADPRDSYSNDPTRRDVDDLAVSLEMSLQLADWLTLKSLTGYRDHKSFLSTDFDQTQLNVAVFTTDVDANQFSQEFTANVNTGRFNGLVGLFYFHEDAYSNLYAPFPGVTVPPIGSGIYIQRGTIDTHAYAAFANGEYEILDGLKLGVGLRFNRERKSNVGEFSGIFGPIVPLSKRSRTWRGTTPRFTLSYEAAPNLNLYANVGRGFKSGQWLVGQASSVDPETIWAYEAGVKARVSGWNTALTGFYYDYKDLQIQRIQNGLQVLQNTPGARIYGAEWENTVRFGQGFVADFGATLLHSSIRGLITQNPNLPSVAVPGQPNTLNPANQDLTGNRLPYAPTLAIRAGVEKSIDWGGTVGTLRGDWSYTSNTFLDVFNDRINSFRPKYSIFDVSYRHELRDSGLSVTLWVKNLTDKRVLMNDNVSLGALGNPELVNYNPPRTFGVTVRIKTGE